MFRLADNLYQFLISPFGITVSPALIDQLRDTRQDAV